MNMFKWLEKRRLNKECHKLNSVYHEVKRIDGLTINTFTMTYDFSAILLINGYGKRKIELFCEDGSDNSVIEKRSKWYKIYGKPWEYHLSNVIDDKGTTVDSYITFYIHDDRIFRKSIKPTQGNGYVIDGEV